MTTISKKRPTKLVPAQADNFQRDYDQVTQLIGENGWAMACMRHPLSTEHSPVMWTYTIGMTAHGRPEMVVQTATAEAGKQLLGVVGATLLRDGAPPLTRGQLVRLPGLPPLSVLPHTNLTPFAFATKRYTFIRMMELVPVRTGS